MESVKVCEVGVSWQVEKPVLQADSCTGAFQTSQNEKFVKKSNVSIDILLTFDIIYK